MSESDHSTRRAYRMTSRAAAAARTRERLLHAPTELYTTRPHDEVTLSDLARQAGVSTPTLLRHFPSKDQLLQAAAEVAREQVVQQRGAALVGDIPQAIDTLLDHYEVWGDRMLHLLQQEDRVPVLRTLTDSGRAVHRDWIDRTFAPLLPATEPACARRTAQLSALCDVFVWKLMRRDLGLSREQTALALHELIAALVPPP